jgi:hypothetical protein
MLKDTFKEPTRSNETKESVEEEKKGGWQPKHKIVCIFFTIFLHLIVFTLAELMGASYQGLKRWKKLR